MASARKTKRFALCLKNDGYPASLEARKVYVVLVDPEAEREGFFRIIDESGEDYLFPKKLFEPLPLSPRAKKAFAGAA